MSCCDRNGETCRQGRDCPDRSPAEDVFRLVMAVIYAAIVLLIIAAVSMSAGVLVARL